jgi:hypothetical protein
MAEADLLKVYGEEIKRRRVSGANDGNLVYF